GIGCDHERVFARFRAAHHLEMKRLTSHGVEDSFVAGGASLADGIVERLRARSDGGDFVTDLKTGGFWREKLVTRVFIGFSLFCRGGRGRRGRRVLLCLEQNAGRKGEDYG